MHRLLLLRHAKSSWADPGVRDHDRPLNDRGRLAAVAMGHHLRARGWVPGLVLCSSARRTCETAALLALPDETRVEIEHDLYLAGPGTVIGQIRAVDEEVSTIMVIGHNPTTEEMALDLASGGDPDALRRLGTKYPTGALAVLDVAGEWSEIETGSASVAAFVTPRDLAAARPHILRHGPPEAANAEMRTVHPLSTRPLHVGPRRRLRPGHPAAHETVR